MSPGRTSVSQPGDPNPKEGCRAGPGIATLTSALRSEGSGQREAAAGQAPSSEGNSTDVRVAMSYHATLTSGQLLAVVLPSELGS